MKGLLKLGRKKLISMDSTEIPDMRPALTPEADENQMIALAMDLAKQRLLNGTASSQEVVHFLKLGSSKARLENEKLKEENKLLRAKTDAMQSAQKSEEIYMAALKAMKEYSGQVDEDEDYEYEDY